MISLGYTTLRAPDGRLVVLPNSIAASQVMINLTQTFTPWQMSISIRISRNADLEATRKLALAVAAEAVGEHAVNGCFVTRIEPSAAVLELRLRAPDAASRDSLRSELLQRLARRFAQADPGATAAEPVSFS